MGRINGERLTVKVSAVQHGGAVVPVDLSVYDTNGNEGIPAVSYTHLPSRTRNPARSASFPAPCAASPSAGFNTELPTPESEGILSDKRDAYVQEEMRRCLLYTSP